MAVDESLRTVLLATTSITDIVGSTGVYVGDAGQSELSAYVVINQESHNPHGALDGTTGIGESQIDLDCYAKKRTQARTLANAVSAKLKDYSGTSGSTTFSAFNWLDEASDIVPADDGSQVHYHVFTETFNVFWSE